MKYKGSCHCGNVAYEVEGTIDSVLACNCSMCQRKGSLLWFVPKTAFRLLTPEDAAKVYLFNKHAIRHRFCPDCGIHPYAESKDAKGVPTAAINVRCIEGIELEKIPVKHWDGRSH
jgi:hypothetical protein